ncbi:MAG: tetratricopeptide repeat protein [Pirellulales bacterium]|nr:tetratricopeptide repeat protein [Pirellulales bacterium]
MNSDYAGEPQFVGKESCIDCHKIEYDLWHGSDHDLAMDFANDSTVKGDFNNATFMYKGREHKFYKRDGKFYVYTDGLDGNMAEFEVKYTFGHYPLQQFLVPVGGGKMQTLALTWDSEKKEWYHMADTVYSDEDVGFSNWLHWTNQSQNWNGMCADCHSTNLQKAYDINTGTFNTTWSEIDVSCEACHGPSSEHIKWANLPDMARPANTNFGLVVQTSNIDNRKYVDLCARCHARRSTFEDYNFKWYDVLDQMLPELPRHPNYYSDGQILEEDYVYGSFTQSRMYMEDVKCNDCHNVHSGKLVLEGNKLCLQCHRMDVYDTYNHHFHIYEGNSTLKVIDEFGVTRNVGEGASCINCHMPGGYYMGVDYRHDHSFRIPRPDLSDKMVTPNTCTQCHANESNQWAANTLHDWYGKKKKPHYGEIFTEAYESKPETFSKLAALANDDLYPVMVRSTAISLMGDYYSELCKAELINHMKSLESLIRYTAIHHFPLASLEDAQVLIPLLNDPVKAVRMEAAVKLLVIPEQQFPGKKRGLLQAVLKEYKEVMEYSGDFSASRHNLGNFYNNTGNSTEAIKHFKEAIKIDSEFYPAKVNLAMVYNSQGENEKAELLLKDVIKSNPEIHDVYYSLGLLLAEMQKYEEALIYLFKAGEVMPYNSRVFYNLGQIQSYLGQIESAEKSFIAAVSIEPESFDYLYVLADFYLNQQMFEKSRAVAIKMNETFPGNRTGEQLLKKINKNPL